MWIRYLFLSLGILGFVLSLSLYYWVVSPFDLWKGTDEEKILYIKTDDSWSDLQENVDSLCPNLSMILFRSLGSRMNLPGNIHSGRYIIDKTQSSIDFIRRLRGGEQNPVSVTIPEVSSIYQALVLGTQNLELDSLDIEEYLKSDTQWISNPHWILPNTYEMYWDVSAEQYMQRLYREGRSFWESAQRLDQLSNLNFTSREAYILASIVNRETNYVKEMDTIAGVYYNRLQMNMPLQADPTIQYIVGPGVKRILYKDLEIDSPFNTYKYTGLPPGPIGLASMQSIQAVLTLKEHDYLYFCANPDRPGTHTFAKTYTRHLQNARKYHRSLN